MSSAILIPVSEYLETTYRPDCDYVDGEVRERSLDEREHAALQGILVKIFMANRHPWDVFCFHELRVQVSAKNYRVPDVCVLRAGDPRDAIVRHPPLICIEVLSRKDTLHELRQRVDDYLQMGVAHVWIFDPWNRKALICTTTALSEPASGELTIPGTPIGVILADIFSELNEML